MSTGWSSHNEWRVWGCLVSTTISSGESPFTLALINCEREIEWADRERGRERPVAKELRQTIMQGAAHVLNHYKCAVPVQGHARHKRTKQKMVHEMGGERFNLRKVGAELGVENKQAQRLI